MTIITDYMVADTVTGQMAPASASTPQELLRVMQLEGIEQCRVNVSWMGQRIFTDKLMTQKDVQKWIQTRQEIDEAGDIS